MNIVTPFPTTFTLNTANPNTEAARRDNALRETIPQSSSTERSEQERGLGSEGDRARQATGQFANPLVYERPTVQTNAEGQTAAGENNQTGDQPDNANEESAGRENAQQQQEEQAEQAEIRELQTRDREVRAHEQAHAAVGGQYAGAPQYEFETGPDGQRYAVGGEVSIDISEESTPEETLRKMQQVRAAALAPADPSPQDLRVASEAAQKASEAQTQIAAQSNEAESDAANIPDASEFEPPSLDEIVDEGDISTPTRTLDNVSLEITDEGASSEQNASGFARGSVISRFYERAVTPLEQGFSATA